jgi:DNA-binding transcriptional regulator YhcF (GntR family)
LKSRNRSPLADFRIDRNSSRPRWLQIYDFLRRAILNGELPAQHRLPSTRRLAKVLRVSRNTVSNAYEELSIEGLLAGQTGSGTYVGESAPNRKVTARPKSLSLRRVMREAHYPIAAQKFFDPDGNLITVCET